MLGSTLAPRRGRVALPRALACFALSLGAALVTAAEAEAQGAAVDTVRVVSARTGRSSVVSGTVTKNSLTEVTVDRDGKETRFDSSEVERISWGGVTAAFREGQVYFDRGDFENSAAKYRQATEAETRDVVKAVARQRTGEALLRLGASDPSRLPEASAEFERFLADHPDDRAVPGVRRMQARAWLLQGEYAKAAEGYSSLYNEGAGTTPSPGYDPLLCARAGVAGAYARLDAGDTLAARDMFGGLRSRLSSMLSQAEAGSGDAVELTALSAEADLGEGFALIAAQQAPQAKSFFQARLGDSQPASSVTHYGALLGMAEAHLAASEPEDARLRFAEVAAIDFTSRDRVARALLGLARATKQIQDGDWKPRVRTWLEQIVGSYGDTPSAAPARALMNELQ